MAYYLQAFLIVLKNKKEEKVRLQNPKFLIQYEKNFPAGLQIVKNTIYSDKSLTDAQKDEKYIEVLKSNIKEVSLLYEDDFDEIFKIIRIGKEKSKISLIIVRSDFADVCISLTYSRARSGRFSLSAISAIPITAFIGVLIS